MDLRGTTRVCEAERLVAKDKILIYLWTIYGSWSTYNLVHNKRKYYLRVLAVINMAVMLEITGSSQSPIDFYEGKNHPEIFTTGARAW